MTTAPSSDPPAQSASPATAPAMLDHVVVGPGASQAPASSSSSVAQPPSARRRHRPTDTIDTTSTDGTGASGSQPAKKNTRGPCRQLKTAKVTRVTNSRISIGYDERHRAAPTAELHSSLAHDIGHVVRTIARCNGSLGGSCLTRSRRRFAASCRRTITWRISTKSR
ncbi:hypothetical protein Prudu_021536 [Prunus dulcis]|uniref:Uncharacterized protein n=1 Tax=Prunus dulcis TaxID=3755 RepID=A0A4Y1RYP7_PRUDU|nr:hypothetical protein Prudu_021536 [Prunus dulcis]